MSNRITPSTRTNLRLLFLGLTVIVAFCVVVRTSSAAAIVWDTPQFITGGPDVSTTGTLIGAFNVGDAGVPGTTVNGVNFQSFAAPGGNGSSGNFTMMPGGGGVFNSNTSGGSANPPFSTLTPAYQTLLMSYVTPLFSPVTLTMSGLSAGTSYQFQFWSNLSSQMFGYQITATAGNSVTLSSNTDGMEGGLGQWVTGSFIADSATQNVTFLGDGDGGFLNGFQLRQTAVPEGGTLSLLAIGLAALAWHQRRRSRRSHA
jgi:hypothetical protein